MKALTTTTLAAAAVALALAAAASPAVPPKLYGTVGPGFTISLKHGTPRTPVKTLRAGLYTFVISDRASIHSFVVEGPGVERDITSVPFTGTKTVTIRLRHGKYKFYCRPHESSMFGFVTVT